MCDYCEKEKVMMQETSVHLGMIHWVGEVKAKNIEAFEYRSGVLVDTRGYLRLVDLDDCGCLDHGKKIKINFCPMCGGKMTHQ